jgi:hypothetical protein
MANVIKRHIASAPADGYAAFYYEWENITVRRKYGGKHNGFVGDGYNHSSENPEMQDDFQNMEHEWVYRVLFYGSEDEITNKEREILKSNDARNSSEWYNLTNASTAYDVSKNQQIKFIVDSINNGEWLQDTELGKSEIQKLIEAGRQVRINSSDPKFTKHISTLIDDKGDTSNTNPLVLVEHIKGEGRLINGNTTGQATIDSKHGKKLKWQLIPYELLKNFSDNDYRALGLALNPKPKNPTNPTNIPDAVVYVMDAYRQGNRPIKDLSNTEYLKEILNFSSTQIAQVYKEAEAQISSGAATTTTPLIRYASKAHKPKLKQRVADLESKLPNTRVFAYSSSMIRYGDIVEKLMINDKRSKNSKDKFSNVMLLIHFSSYTDISNWNSKRCKLDTDIMESLCSKYGLGFSNIEYMPKY